jgi:hypothetical protein
MSAKLSMPAPKRVGPPKVKPVRHGATRIEAVHWGRERGLGQNGGYIAAFDEATGKELWTLQVYRIDYDKGMEEDVQDVFIKKMVLDGDRLEIVDEDRRRYAVDLTTRSVTRLK